MPWDKSDSQKLRYSIDQSRNSIASQYSPDSFGNSSYEMQDMLKKIHMLLVEILDELKVLNETK